MRGREAVARAEKSDGTDEVVGDNSDCINNLAIPKVVLKEKAPCSAASSNDQQVPSMQNFKNGLSSRKRVLPVEEGQLQKNMQISDRNSEGETSKIDDDLCSTVVSSSAKKQQLAAGLPFPFHNLVQYLWIRKAACLHSYITSEGNSILCQNQPSSSRLKRTEVRSLYCDH